MIFLLRTILRLLLENLIDEIGATRALVFGVLTEMLKQEYLISCFQGYTELIILKVLESHRDPEKDVSKKEFRSINRRAKKNMNKLFWEIYEWLIMFPTIG